MVSWAAAWRALCVMTGVRTSKSSSMLALTEVLCQAVADGLWLALALLWRI